MRIGHLISDYLPSLGGAQVCVHNICSELAGNDDYVVVVTPGTSSAVTTKYKIVKISKWYLRWFRIPLVGEKLLQSKLRRLQKKYRFDVWQVTIGYPFGAYAVDFFKKNNIPCVLRCSGEDIQIDKERSYGYRLSGKVDRIVREKYPRFDGLVALTESVRKEYLSIGIAADKIKVIPNGVSVRRFQRKADREEIETKYGLRDKKVLLTVGRNHPKKGYDLIPKILHHIQRKRRDIVWLVIGEGCASDRFVNWGDDVANDLILINGIHMGRESGFDKMPPTELIEFYHAADLFVFPSYLETFGMVLIEANAAGLPVVTSDVSGCRDVIKDGFNGFLVEAGDCEMFAKKILTLLNSRRLYSEICVNISKNIQKYDWSVVAGEYRKMYANIISDRQELVCAKGLAKSIC